MALVGIDTIRYRQYRHNLGDLDDLMSSIQEFGMLRPVVLWKDGTLISGERRYRAAVKLGMTQIPAETVKDIVRATALIRDDEQSLGATTRVWSEAGNLWAVLHELDAPARARRIHASRVRGARAGTLTRQGKREAGRTDGLGADLFVPSVAAAFSISEATARRIWRVWQAANDPTWPSGRRALAQEVLRDIDVNGNIWGNYQRLNGKRALPARSAQPEPAPGPVQLQAYTRAVPSLAGVLDGLERLGPVNPDLTWEQVAPHHAMLMDLRRRLDKMIKQMKEKAK